MLSELTIRSPRVFYFKTFHGDRTMQIRAIFFDFAAAGIRQVRIQCKRCIYYTQYIYFSQNIRGHFGENPSLVILYIYRYVKSNTKCEHFTANSNHKKRSI